MFCLFFASALSCPAVPYRACTVSFTERGQQHQAHVDAETAFEAATLALKFFQSSRYVKGPGDGAKLLIEVNSPRRLLVELKVADVIQWLYRTPPNNPAEKTRKERLRALMNDDRNRRV